MGWDLSQSVRSWEGNAFPLPQKIVRRDAERHGNVQGMLGPELVQFDRPITCGEHPVTHAVDLVPEHETDGKVIDPEGRQGNGAIRLLERNDTTALGASQGDRFHRVIVSTPRYAVLCPERTLVDPSVIAWRREPGQIDVRGAHGIRRSKDRSNVVRRPDVIGQDP